MALMTCKRQGDCWCSICHTARLNQYISKDSNILLKDFEKCKRKEHKLLSNLFEEILKSVAIAKAFRVKAEQETGYKQMKRHLLFLGLDPEYATNLARTINNAVWVFDNFERITFNLNVCTDINIRRLSLHQLYLAKDMSWCLMYQEQLRGHKKKPKLLDYDEESFEDLAKYIESHPAFLAVSDDPKRVTALMTRLQKRVLSKELKK